MPVPRDAVNALAVPGSRHALWQFARISVVLASIALGLSIAAVLVAIVHGPSVAVMFCAAFAGVFALVLVPISIGVIRSALVMREYPWQPYQASVSLPPTQKVRPRIEIWRDDEGHGGHWYLKISVSAAGREALRMYRYVWMAGDPGRGCVIAPAGGGPLLWATRDRLMTRLRTGAFRPASQSSQVDPTDHTRTPDNFRVPAPEGHALSTPGSSRALWRFARRAVVWWAVAVVVIAVFAVLVATGAPLGAVIGWTYVAVGTAIPLVRRTAAVAGVTGRMATRPWVLYGAKVTVPVSGKVRMEVWPDGDQKSEHRHLKVKSSMATRAQLGSTTYRYVWIAGVPGRRAVLVPAGGGPLVWAAHDEQKPAGGQAAHDVPHKARRGSGKTPKVLLAQEARRKARELEREDATGSTSMDGPS